LGIKLGIESLQGCVHVLRHFFSYCSMYTSQRGNSGYQSIEFSRLPVTFPLPVMYLFSVTNLSSKSEYILSPSSRSSNTLMWSTHLQVTVFAELPHIIHLCGLES
jgi:hypothetical protein